LGLGIDKNTWYKEKFGEERVAMMQERLLQIGKDAGIDFKFGGKTGKHSTALVHS
jgi:predicted DsbA family dithiol-disulfide isomerase